VSRRTYPSKESRTTDRTITWRLNAGSILLAAALIGAVVPAAFAQTAVDRGLDTLEAQLVRDPSSLRNAAEYRQRAIAMNRYDRSITLFERLSKDGRGGANGFLNLALAYIDKVPVSGTLRQALLGRDAITAASRAIAIEPSVVAYFIRGLVNLYYDRALFHRTDKGVADLEKARTLAIATPALPSVRVFVALGDGYWRLNQPQKAREIWREGLTRYPETASLVERLHASDDRVGGIVARALDPNRRVDTTLRELFPDLTLAFKTPQ